MIVRHIEGSLDGQSPFPAKIAFVPGLGLGRHQRHEIIAVANLLADLLIPCVPATQLAFVMPDFEPIGRERIPDPPCCLSILRRVAQKNADRRVDRALRRR